MALAELQSQPDADAGMTTTHPDNERRGEVRIRFCRNSLLAGLVFGALSAGGSVGAVWLGVMLADRGEITREMLSKARCDESGWVSIVYPDGSQYTCTPRQLQPPTSREEAAARRRGR